MRSTIKELYAKILESEREVMFSDDECVYVIFEASDGGWNVDTYTMEDEFNADTGEETYQLKFVDGGLCTGNEYDAIEFMMPTQINHHDDDQGYDEYKEERAGLI